MNHRQQANCCSQAAENGAGGPTRVNQRRSKKRSRVELPVRSCRLEAALFCTVHPKIDHRFHFGAQEVSSSGHCDTWWPDSLDHPVEFESFDSQAVIFASPMARIVRPSSDRPAFVTPRFVHRAHPSDRVVVVLPQSFTDGGTVTDMMHIVSNGTECTRLNCATEPSLFRSISQALLYKRLLGNCEPNCTDYYTVDGSEGKWNSNGKGRSPSTRTSSTYPQSNEKRDRIPRTSSASGSAKHYGNENAANDGRGSSKNIEAQVEQTSHEADGRKTIDNGIESEISFDADENFTTPKPKRKRDELQSATKQDCGAKNDHDGKQKGRKRLKRLKDVKQEERQRKERRVSDENDGDQSNHGAAATASTSAKANKTTTTTTTTTKEEEEEKMALRSMRPIEKSREGIFQYLRSFMVSWGKVERLSVKKKLLGKMFKGGGALEARDSASEKSSLGGSSPSTPVPTPVYAPPSQLPTRAPLSTQMFLQASSQLQGASSYSNCSSVTAENFSARSGGLTATAVPPSPPSSEQQRGLHSNFHLSEPQQHFQHPHHPADGGFPYQPAASQRPPAAHHHHHHNIRRYDHPHHGHHLQSASDQHPKGGIAGNGSMESPSPLPSPPANLNGTRPHAPNVVVPRPQSVESARFASTPIHAKENTFGGQTAERKPTEANHGSKEDCAEDQGVADGGNENIKTRKGGDTLVGDSHRLTNIMRIPKKKHRHDANEESKNSQPDLDWPSVSYRQQHRYQQVSNYRAVSDR